MKLFIAITSLLLSTQLWAHEGHDHGDQPTPPVASKPEACSTQIADLCAHIHFLTDLNYNDEVQFITHISTPNNEVIEEAQIDLWMNMGNGHGHGSAPVTIEKMSEQNHFKVSQAYFIMAGPWLVRVKFNYNGAPVELDIPVNVAP